MEGERLTEVFEENGEKKCAIIGCREFCDYGFSPEESGCRCKKVRDIQSRLSYYEDTGLMPKDVLVLKSALTEAHTAAKNALIALRGVEEDRDLWKRRAEAMK